MLDVGTSSQITETGHLVVKEDFAHSISEIVVGEVGAFVPMLDPFMATLSVHAGWEETLEATEGRVDATLETWGNFAHLGVVVSAKAPKAGEGPLRPNFPVLLDAEVHGVIVDAATHYPAPRTGLREG